MAVGTVPNRRLNDTARRVRDELGKGQETLRKASVSFRVDNVARTQWAQILFPDVDIRVVAIVVTSAVKLTGSDANTLDVLKSGGSDEPLITQFDPDTLTAKTPSTQTLLAAANNVAAATPILAKLVNGSTGAGAAAAPTDVTVEVSYILADDARSYGAV